MIFILGVLLFLFMIWIGFRITGILVSAFLWLFIMLPLAFAACMIGIICCCTILLIPLGLWFFRLGIRFALP